MDGGPGTEPPPAACRRVRRALIAVGSVAVLAAGAGVGWWALPRPLSAEERHLVGTWKYQWDQFPGELGLEYEFRADRTCRTRNFDPTTGALVHETAGATWRLSGSTLTVRTPGAAAGSRWHVLPAQWAADEVSVLTPDGPDRFRYRGAIEVRSTPTGPPVTGTLTRVRPVE
jgi:hypothetical protein